MDNLIGEVIEWMREEEEGEKIENAKVDPGGGANLTSTHTQGPGEDSPPYAKDLAVMVKVPGAENYITVGYIDPVNEGTAANGEVRRYARDADGKQICELWLKSDGTILIKNDNGYIEMGSDGTMDVNGNLTVRP